jgi:hypothetical protein
MMMMMMMSWKNLKTPRGDRLFDLARGVAGPSPCLPRMLTVYASEYSLHL